MGDRTARAINSIIAALQDDGRGKEILSGTNLRPVAERIYQRAARDVYEAVAAEMRDVR